MQASSNEPTLSDVLREISELRSQFTSMDQRLERNSQDLEQLSQEFSQMNQEFSQMKQEITQTQKWQDRTWDVIKWVGGISVGLSISAAIALLGLSLRYQFM